MSLRVIDLLGSGKIVLATTSTAELGVAVRPGNEVELQYVAYESQVGEQPSVVRSFVLAGFSLCVCDT